MGRKILLVTTDQQRYDTLGCNGGTQARTSVVDGLARQGIRYSRAVPQSVVCMPSRSTILTGQHPSSHGVWMNGVPLPADAPSVAEVLRQLHRYVQFPGVQAIVLVTTKARHLAMPAMLNRKPLHVASLLGGAF